MNESDSEIAARTDGDAEHHGRHWAIEALLWFPELIGGVVRGVAWCVVCLVEVITSMN